MRHFLGLALAIAGLARRVIARPRAAALVARPSAQELSPPRGRAAGVAAVGVAAVTASAQQELRPTLATGALPEVVHRHGEQRGTRRDGVAGPSWSRDNASPPAGRSGYEPGRPSRLSPRPASGPSALEAIFRPPLRAARPHGTGAKPPSRTLPLAPSCTRFHALSAIDAARFSTIASTRGGSVRLRRGRAAPQRVLRRRQLLDPDGRCTLHVSGSRRR